MSSPGPRNLLQALKKWDWISSPGLKPSDRTWGLANCNWCIWSINCNKTNKTATNYFLTSTISSRTRLSVCLKINCKIVRKNYDILRLWIYASKGGRLVWSVLWWLNIFAEVNEPTFCCGKELQLLHRFSWLCVFSRHKMLGVPQLTSAAYLLSLPSTHQLKFNLYYFLVEMEM